MVLISHTTFDYPVGTYYVLGEYLRVSILCSACIERFARPALCFFDDFLVLDRKSRAPYARPRRERDGRETRLDGDTARHAACKVHCLLIGEQRLQIFRKLIIGKFGEMHAPLPFSRQPARSQLLGAALIRFGVPYAAHIQVVCEVLRALYEGVALVIIHRILSSRRRSPPFKSLTGYGAALGA